mmetsp:Transcript_48070/g.150839  ORF Transcript_48070/g.150839 Transcript_48070/m.150839 type:complete len:799 (-) Transcript_48070:45-2441(-)
MERVVDARTDAASELVNENDTLLQGELEKRGGSGHSFKFRWVKATRKEISYSVTPKTPAITSIRYEEITWLADGLNHSRGADNDLIVMPARPPKADDESGIPKCSVQVVWKKKPDEEIDKKSLDLQHLDFALGTSKNGFFRGRIFVFRTKNVDELEMWVEGIQRLLRYHQDTEIVNLSRFEMIRKTVRWFYVGDRCQFVLAAVIVSNFICNIFEAQMHSASGTDEVFAILDVLFTIFFTIELLINMFSTFFWEFISSRWNWFDMCVVLISLISVFINNLPGANVLRLLRCFRVFRLFNRIKSLKMVLLALTASIPPMVNAFALVCLVIAIYSIVAVQFFKQQQPELFGDFFTSMFTMFQVMTLDNWSDIVRALWLQTNQEFGVACFFCSFQLIATMVLLNVVIAVLLDNFSDASREEAIQEQSQFSFNADYTLARMVNSISNARDSYELEVQIDSLFDKLLQLNRDRIMQTLTSTPSELKRLGYFFNRWRCRGIERVQKNKLSFMQFRNGFKMMRFIPPIIITQDFWKKNVQSAGLCDRQGLLPRSSFHTLLKCMLRQHDSSLINFAMEMNFQTEKDHAARVISAVLAVICDDPAKGIHLHRAASENWTEIHNMLDSPTETKLMETLSAKLNSMHERLDKIETELRENTPRKMHAAIKESIGNGHTKLKANGTHNLVSSNGVHLSRRRGSQATTGVSQKVDRKVNHKSSDLTEINRQHQQSDLTEINDQRSSVPEEIKQENEVKRVIETSQVSLETQDVHMNISAHPMLDTPKGPVNQFIDGLVEGILSIGKSVRSSA